MNRHDIERDLERLRTLPGTTARAAAEKGTRDQPATAPIARRRPKLTPTKQRLGAQRIAQQLQSGPERRPGGNLALRAEYR